MSSRTESSAPAVADLPDALLRPSVWPHPVESVRLIETHISWVFLTGDFAYKVKKPVRFPFLDYSTPARREAACHEELRLNRRLAPDLYLDVAPISVDGDGLRVGIDSDPVEFAVRMREFPQSALLSNRAADGTLDATLIDDLAMRLARFHTQDAAVAPAGGALGQPESVARWAWDNFATLDALNLAAALAAKLTPLRAWMSAHDAAHAERFAARLANGFVRECHGDLHLGNVVEIDGHAIPFDGIEFNAELRWIDVMSEVAFLLMDLIERGHPAQGWRAINAYLEATGDYAGLAVLRYYLIYRAMVRAKVAVLSSKVNQLSAADVHTPNPDAERYLDLAGRFAHPSPPRLTILHGLSGAGKTTVARRLAETEAAVMLRSDVERKRMAGLRPTDSAGDEVGSGLYSDTARDAVYRRLAVLAEGILAAGWSCIVDAAFLERVQRDRFRALARRLGVEFRIVNVDLPCAELERRIVARQEERCDASDAGLAVLAHQIETREALGADELPERVAADVALAEAAGASD